MRTMRSPEKVAYTPLNISIYIESELKKNRVGRLKMAYPCGSLYTTLFLCKSVADASSLTPRELNIRYIQYCYILQIIGDAVILKFFRKSVYKNRT